MLEQSFINALVEVPGDPATIAAYKDDDYPNQPWAVESWAAAFEREGGKWVATDGIHELKE